MLALIEYNGPAYLRLGRMAVETVTDTIDGYKFELGKAAMLRDGKDVTIAATGLMVQRALAAAELLSGEGEGVVFKFRLLELWGELMEYLGLD